MSLAQYFDLPRLQNVSPGAVFVCALLFVVGMALLGSLKLAGAFYIASLVLGLYLLWRLPRVEIVIPPAVRLYLGFYLGFCILVLVHVALFSASTSNIDQVSRIGFGLLNGFTFLALFGFSREKLFDFVVLVAAAHAVVAIAVALYQGFDFARFDLTGQRAHGVTNPIPFSEMLLTSVGLVALAVAARLDPSRRWAALSLLALVVAVGLFAVFLTGTRGTLMAFLLLFPLLMVAVFGLVNVRLAAIVTVLALGVLLVPAAYMFEPYPGTGAMLLDFLKGADVSAYNEDSVGLRFRLWVYALDLIREAPLLGHGIDSFPDVLRRPELGVPADSILFKFSNVHNQYLDMVMKMGLLGAVLFFGPIAVALTVGLRMTLDPAERARGIAIVWVVGAYSIYGLTQTFYGHASTTLHFGVYLGMLIWLAPGGRYGDVAQRPETVS